MCGIAGFIDLKATMAEPTLRSIAKRMGNALHHRGPDGDGVWADPRCGLALAHRRLAIIDLSSTGHQPMASASGRLVIVYNGEVFNFLELRRDLERRGRRFRGHSDTEVILQACEQWGVECAVSKFVGMFAFALWDRAERRLTLVRDRLGIKPLFWGRHDQTVLFASQPKAFREHPAWRPEIDPDAVAQFLRFNYVPAPRSIWKGIQKLRPGHLVVIEADGTAREQCWWDLRAIAADGVQHPIEASDREVVEMFDELARDAVRRRLVADVPLGAFLSGGIDSSTVVALMRSQTNGSVKTFTIGFSQETHDEAPHARAVAAHLGTDHTELYVEPEKLVDLVPRLSTYFDEPFADPSEIPTLMLSELTRRSLTVALAGDGGDEIFAGYTRYHLAARMAGSLGGVPRWMRAITAGALQMVPCGVYDAPFRVLPSGVRPCLVGDRAHKFAGILDFHSADDLYGRLVRIWDRSLELVPSAKNDGVTAFDDQRLASDVPDFPRRMQLVDELTYLPDWILAKTDRATMAVGLEARVPLLDHRIVELGWRLPSRFLCRHGQAKWLLRRVLERYVPLHLFERPKRGFEPPVGVWLRGPLREWAEDLLGEKRLAADGLLDPAPIRRRLKEHLAGTRNWQYSLWGVLMLQAWRARWT
jgi:asparagine synthase (glutamine-hydrolysing)